MTIGIGLGIGLGMGGGIRTQASKAGRIPVPGALVIAPLWESFLNYGSLGGSFATGGAPTLSSTYGATFGGASDYAYLTTGTVTDATLIAKIRTTSTAGDRSMLALMAAGASPSNQGIAAERYGGHWNMLLYGITRITGSVADDADAHVVTIQRTASGTTLWIDGVQSATSASAGSASDAVVLAAKYFPTWGSYAAGSVQNLALYHSALSAGDRALVESWAAR